MPCAMCNASEPDELCRYHPKEKTDDWAEGNRVICDFIHRGKKLNWGKKYPKPEPLQVEVTTLQEPCEPYGGWA